MELSLAASKRVVVHTKTDIAKAIIEKIMKTEKMQTVQEYFLECVPAGHPSQRAFRLTAAEAWALMNCGYDVEFDRFWESKFNPNDSATWTAEEFQTLVSIQLGCTCAKHSISNKPVIKAVIPPSFNPMAFIESSVKKSQGAIPEAAGGSSADKDS